MDRTGRVNGLFKRLKIAKQAVEIRNEPPPLPGRGPYRVIVADLPWPYEIRREDPSHRANTPYPQMTIAEICAVRVQEIAHADCVLFLWTTNFHMRNAFAVLDAWGFEDRTILTWAKDRMGTGDWLRGQTEHCLMAGRGKPVLALTNQTTLLHAPVRGHSAKPREFYDLVESLCPAPRYADLFSRYRHNDKWDCHGDEAPPETGNGLKFTPERVEQIKNLVERGISLQQIAESNGCTVFSLVMACKRAGVNLLSLMRNAEPPPVCEMPDIPDFLRRDATS
jgi:N6-adenosine-specific RNA methylase IME4